jgi:hypothetical protein
MNDTLITILPSIITGLLSFGGVYISNSKNNAIWQYRLEELEKRVDKHNNLIDRMYKVEERLGIIEAKEEEE